MSVSIKILLLVAVAAHTALGLECEICFDDTCLGRQSCDSMPLQMDAFGDMRCFTHSGMKIRGCVQESACGSVGIECCSFDGCNEGNGYTPIRSQLLLCIIVTIVATVMLLW